MLVGERVRHRPPDDLLGETLDDGRLAHAGFADEHGVVLGAARQHLHDPLDLVDPTDHRIQLALSSELGEVATELIQDGGSTRGSLAAGRRATRTARVGRRFLPLDAGQQLDDRLPHFVQLGTELLQHLGRDALSLANQPEQDVLSADVVVTELQRLAQRELEHLLRPGGEGNVPARGLGALADDLDHLGAD